MAEPELVANRQYIADFVTSSRPTTMFLIVQRFSDGFPLAEGGMIAPDLFRPGIGFEPKKVDMAKYAA